jgi:hypothetical protein
VYKRQDLWGGDEQVGVMSDEVRDVMPNAVSVNSSGYDLVDYWKVIYGN